MERTTFTVFCIENYKVHHNMSGKDTVRLFNDYGVFDYLDQHYDVLHTTGDMFIVNDIDEFLKVRKANIS